MIKNKTQPIMLETPLENTPINKPTKIFLHVGIATITLTALAPALLGKM